MPCDQFSTNYCKTIGEILLRLHEGIEWEREDSSVGRNSAHSQVPKWRLDFSVRLAVARYFQTLLRAALGDLQAGQTRADKHALT
ncbi:hypothetical protein F0562_031022 [Nyssa sinensis]|uniref:Uncharacterized protein n=1 Tax=Nyssa sinensis TaxID=561372 RepID=A0A5J5ATE0_9ASTE|nr:hypothetical protein F0562_031022 [Nyssa sinensis]